MDAGHHSGFNRSVVDEDSVVQVSMGPIVDRSKDNLSGSDGAVANARLLLLDVLAAYERGELPPGSARGPGTVRIPDPYDAVLGPDESWRDIEPDTRSMKFAHIDRRLVVTQTAKTIGAEVTGIEPDDLLNDESIVDHRDGRARSQRRSGVP